MLSNRVSSTILFITVAVAPFPFGSTDSTAIALWCIVLGLSIIVASPRGIHAQHFPLFALAAVVVFAYAFVLHEQLADHPWIAKPYPLWSEAAAVLQTPIAPTASIARHQPFFSLGAPLANMLALMCSFIVCTDRKYARRLVLVIAWSGVAYAVYGLAAYLIDPTYILGREKIAHRFVLTSTFLNRNTAAAYFGSCAVLWLLLLTENLRRHLSPDRMSWKNMWRLVLEGAPRSVILSFAMLDICLAAMLMTNSRAGIVLSLMALVIGFTAFIHRDIAGRGGIVVTLSIGAVVALLILQFLGGNVSGRFDLQGLSDEGRIATYLSTFKMIAAHPWFGTGLGTFMWAFPAYRSADISMWGVWDRAHSTPLELASDVGLPMTGLIVFAWLIVLGVLVHGIRHRRRDLIVPVGAFSVAILSLAHSTIDFPLQIPGYAIVVFALVGAGLAQSFSSIHSNRYEEKQK